MRITDHPRSGMVYNFSRVCMHVCVYVCLSDENSQKSWCGKFTFALINGATDHVSLVVGIGLSKV